MLNAAMINALVMMGILGLLIGIGLAIASRVFYVYVDPKVEAVESALPGANCGGCGLPGCSANASAIVAGKSSPGSCVAGGPDLAQVIAALMGMALEAKEPDIAAPDCTYSVARARQKFVYNGISDCRAAALLSGGMKVCTVGCLGLGTCVRACPFGALSMGENGLPVVDKDKCTGCGTCERVCPKHIIRLSSVTRRILREYTVEDCVAPCRRACPAGIDIPEYIRQIALGDYSRSVAVIKERLPFPTVIGRICPRFCETSCRRNLVDEPLAINGLKRFVADVEKASGRVKPFMAPSTGRKVAVIGGGVEGLSAGYFSARLGHSALVLEASQTPGGLLRKAIAAERLPQEVLDYDIAGIAGMGVTIKTGKIAGKDFAIDSLLADNFEAVLLATGGWDSRLGADNPKALGGPVEGMALLIDVLKKETPAKGHVVVIGGGSLARQTVDACKAAGAASVTFVLREKSAAEAGLPGGGLDATIALGAVAQRFYGTGRAVSQVEYTDEATGQPRTVPANTVLFATGRFPELIFARQPDGDEPREDTGVIDRPVEWQAMSPYKTPEFAERQGVFADGDPVSDMDAAIKAINAGRKAAACMHMLMYGDPMALPDNVLSSNAVVQTVQTVYGVLPKPRTLMPLRSDDEVATGLEREAGFSEAAARAEADRCLQCGIICYEHS